MSYPYDHQFDQNDKPALVVGNVTGFILIDAYKNPLGLFFPSRTAAESYAKDIANNPMVRGPLTLMEVAERL